MFEAFTSNGDVIIPEINDQKRIKLRLGFEDKDHCRSIVTKNLFFDLEPLRKTSLKGPVPLICLLGVNFL